MSIREEITGHYREAIITGEYPAGSTLPPTLAIAAEFGTKPCNVQRALARLVEEGFIERTPRLGTRVRARRRALHTVALVTYTQSLGMRQYQSFFLNEFIRRLDGQGIGVRSLHNDGGGLCLNAVERLLKSDRAQAVFLLEPDAERVPEFLSLPAPVLGLSGNIQLPRVGFDRAELPKILTRELKQAGIRRLAAIEAIGPSLNSASSECSAEQFRRIFSEDGIEWVQPLPSAEALWKNWHGLARWGYDAFLRLTELPDLPEALFIYPDDVAPGVIAAAYRKRIDLNRMFKRIFVHRNAEFPVLFPGRADFLEIRLAEAVDAAVKLLHNLYTGTEPREYKIHHHLVQGEE